MRTTKIPNYAIIETDENGLVVMFKLPHYALNYDTALSTISRDMRTDEIKYSLCDRAYARQDDPDRLVFDADDKMDLINNVKKTGRWI